MYGKKSMYNKGGKKKFPDLTGDGKVTRADILKGRGVFKKGGGKETVEKARKADYVPQTQREKGNDYFPQSRRREPTPKAPMTGIGGKLEGSAKNFAAIAERARKAKKPR